MSRSVVHASFTITRRWKASPARVFAAFADEKQKDKWFAGLGSWTKVERSFDGDRGEMRAFLLSAPVFQSTG